MRLKEGLIGIPRDWQSWIQHSVSCRRRKAYLYRTGTLSEWGHTQNAGLAVSPARLPSHPGVRLWDSRSGLKSGGLGPRTNAINELWLWMCHHRIWTLVFSCVNDKDYHSNPQWGVIVLLGRDWKHMKKLGYHNDRGSYLQLVGGERGVSMSPPSVSGTVVHHRELSVPRWHHWNHCLHVSDDPWAPVESMSPTPTRFCNTKGETFLGRPSIKMTWESFQII